MKKLFAYGKLSSFLLCGLMSGCSGQKELDIPVPPQEEEQKKFIPVEKLVFRLNGELYECGGINPSDTAKVYEEGLRTLEIAGYLPAEATAPVIEEVNIYRDVYSFNYSGDSIYVLGGSSALPKNHYISAVGDGFQTLVGKRIPSSGGQGASIPQVRFYNYVNRSYDETTIDRGSGPVTVKWSDLGRYRLYRIEVSVSAMTPQGEKETGVFALPFYELENSVEIADLQDGAISISPGDTICLKKLVNAPAEFTQCEWVKGIATARFNPLNGDAVERVYKDNLGNPLQAEEGMRFTDSMVHLTRDGKLWVDSYWNPNDAASNGGAVYASIPICVIMMPHGSSQSSEFSRDFIFPDSTRHHAVPTPFFCNAQINISY